VDSTIRRWFWILLGLCALGAALILALLPAEKTLGQVIKLVYFHGALSRAGMAGFVASGVAGVIYLVRRVPGALRWSTALATSGWLFWAAHFLVSMPATRLTWGPWIAWGEPRVTMTLQILAAGLVVILVSRLLENSLFTAGADALLGLAVFLMAARTGVLRHPLDPIGSSPSLVLRLAYLALLVPVAAAMGVVAWRMAVRAPQSPAAVPDELIG